MKLYRGLLLGALLVTSACGIKETVDGIRDLRDIDAGGIADDLLGKSIGVLEELFPELKTEVLVEVALDVPLEDLHALRDELLEARAEARKLTRALFRSAEERVSERQDTLGEQGAYPTQTEPVGRVCTYDTETGAARVELSGVFQGDAAVTLEAEQIGLTVDGESQPFQLSCASEEDVDVVFLIDITGSMGDVIAAVRDSVVSFVDALEARDLSGSVSVVTFQDSVGVNVPFQRPAPDGGVERSPFFAPVSLTNASGVQSLRDFVKRLEANRGADVPENLAGALDFARNSVIGYDRDGSPNVIGEGGDDPPSTQPFPPLRGDRQVFVVLTDAAFHGDDRNEDNSSLQQAFVPRDTAEILASLQASASVVHVADLSWVDETLNPEDAPRVDADYWAIHTGGVGQDRVEGYSILDLELVVVAKDKGLLDITLDRVLASSCSLQFERALTVESDVRLSLEFGGETTFDTALSVQRF